MDKNPVTWLVDFGAFAGLASTVEESAYDHIRAKPQLLLRESESLESMQEEKMNADELTLFLEKDGGGLDKSATQVQENRKRTAEQPGIISQELVYYLHHMREKSLETSVQPESLLGRRSW
jgi:hypothetical protein